MGKPADTNRAGGRGRSKTPTALATESSQGLSPDIATNWDGIRKADDLRAMLSGALSLYESGVDDSAKDERFSHVQLLLEKALDEAQVIRWLFEGLSSENIAHNERNRLRDERRGAPHG